MRDLTMLVTQSSVVMCNVAYWLYLSNSVTAQQKWQLNLVCSGLQTEVISRVLSDTVY